MAQGRQGYKIGIQVENLLAKTITLLNNSLIYVCFMSLLKSEANLHADEMSAAIYFRQN